MVKLSEHPASFSFDTPAAYVGMESQALAAAELGADGDGGGEMVPWRGNVAQQVRRSSRIQVWC